MVSSESGKWLEVGSCENGSEPSNSMKFGKFLSS
jgi:hypothetical protein